MVILSELCCIEADFEAPAELADLHILHTIERPIKKAIAEVDVSDHTDETGHANEGVDLLTVVDTADLNLVITIDFLACVIECHFFFRVTARPGSWLNFLIANLYHFF